MAKTLKSSDVLVKIFNEDHSKERFVTLEDLRKEFLEAGMPKERVDMFSYKLFKEGEYFSSKSGLTYQIIVSQEEPVIREISPCENCKIRCQAVCFQCAHNRSLKEFRVRQIKNRKP